MGKRQGRKEALEDMEACGIIGDRGQVTLVARPAVFLDRDGVLIQNREEWAGGSILDIRLLPGAKEAVALLRRKGYLVCIVTNQAGVARGQSTEERQRALNDHIAHNLGGVDGIAMCIHHPDDGCDCRKPKPGVILDLARDLNIDLDASWMVGDMDSDIEAGVAAGCQTVRVSGGDSAHERGDFTCRSLSQAARFIVAVPLVGPSRLQNTTCGAG